MIVTRAPATKLWLDDVRRPPSDEWTWAKSVTEAVEVLRSGAVAEAALDHDLYPFVEDGLEVVKWMINKKVFPPVVRVHTANRFASTKMCGLLERNGYEPIPGRPRWFAKSETQGDRF